MSVNKDKFFGFMDAFPLVRLLQITAAAIFVLSVLQVIFTAGAYYMPLTTYRGGPTPNFVGGTVNLAGGLVNTVVTPLILLALAEIVKTLRK